MLTHRYIMKQTRSLYARANIIIRKYLRASLNTKLTLFIAYCTPIYGYRFWSTMFQYSYSKITSCLWDNYYMNQDGVVHHVYLCFIMCRHLLELFVNWGIRFYVLFVIVTICWFVLCSTATWHVVAIISVWEMTQATACILVV